MVYQSRFATHEQKLAQAKMVMLQHNWRPEHHIQVQKLAGQLFEGLRPLHNMGDQEKLLLEAAALLHDIGWTISGTKHHKHSVYLIRQSNLSLFSNRDLAIIMNLVRYHRRGGPESSHRRFSALTKTDQEIVKRLVAILRVADGLDKSNEQLIHRLMVDIEPETITCVLVSRDNCDRDIEGAMDKRELFEEVFQRQLAFRVETPVPTQAA
jgi:exopolyphosphatase/guanosine-5'-triphosphate,3'-diphosphate pyrophosphatase